MSTGASRRRDLALIANVCHLFGENTNLQLLRRVADALRPAGRIAIVDILPTERGDGPRPAVSTPSGSCCAPAAAGSIPIRPSDAGSARRLRGPPARAPGPSVHPDNRDPTMKPLPLTEQLEECLVGGKAASSGCYASGPARSCRVSLPFRFVDAIAAGDAEASSSWLRYFGHSVPRSWPARPRSVRTPSRRPSRAST